MSSQSMRGKSYIAVLIVASCLVAGCTTPYLAEQQGLALKRDRGEISEEEYEAALRKQREAQPWAAQAECMKSPLGLSSSPSRLIRRSRSATSEGRTFDSALQGPFTMENLIICFSQPRSVARLAMANLKRWAEKQE